MAQRKVKKRGETHLVEKKIVLEDKFPFFSCLQEVEEQKNDLTKEQYLAIAQSFNEIEVWENASWKERQLLAPIVDMRYDFNNAPILILPKFEPLCGETEANYYEESEVIEEFHRRLALKGLEDYQIGKTIEGFYKICENYNLNPADVVENLSNIGWHPLFGCRIIDYGLSNQIFYNYTHWEEE